MEMEMEVEIEMEVEMQMAMEMHMQMEMEIFKAPEASCELTLASKMLFASDFEALEVYGCTTSRSREHHKAPGEASRGSYEAPWRCFGSFWRSRKLPKPRSSIHSSFSETPRSLPESPKSGSIDPVDVLEPPGGYESGLSRGWAGVGLERAGAPESPMNQRSPDI